MVLFQRWNDGLIWKHQINISCFLEPLTEKCDGWMLKYGKETQLLFETFSVAIIRQYRQLKRCRREEEKVAK